MQHIKCHSRSGRPDVQDGDRSLKSVMSRLMKEVTESDDAHGLAGEIHSQPRCAPGKNTRYRIQFLPTVAKIISSYEEVGRAQGRAGGEQKGIFPVPKSMAGGLWQHHGFDRPDHRIGLNRSGRQ